MALRFVGDHLPLSPEQCRKWLQVTTANYASSDAFAATTFEQALRARGVDRLVLAGVQSEHCIRATALGALERGFGVVLVRDGHSTYPAGTRPAEDISAAVNAELSDRVTAAGAAEVTF